ncbi:MAG: HAD hydrolase-like protein [Myxococcota bacterium]
MARTPAMLLFDIDGTLIRCGGAGRAALNRAFRETHGIEDALSGVRLDGSTDPRIVEDGFQQKLGRSPTGAELDAIMERYLLQLEQTLRELADSYVVLEGVRSILDQLAGAPGLVVGLATGNYERGARIKLEPADLNRYFGFGGYGSDAKARPALVAKAIERGQLLAQTQIGAPIPLDRVFVFGDTEHDVTAAHAAGARAVGVLAGASHPELLRAARPDQMLDSFADPRLFELL